MSFHQKNPSATQYVTNLLTGSYLKEKLHKIYKILLELERFCVEKAINYLQ